MLRLRQYVEHLRGIFTTVTDGSLLSASSSLLGLWPYLAWACLFPCVFALVFAFVFVLFATTCACTVAVAFAVAIDVVVVLAA